MSGHTGGAGRPTTFEFSDLGVDQFMFLKSTISHFHALSIDKCMFCLQMPPVFFDSMKIFMFEHIKIEEESIKLMG